MVIYGVALLAGCMLGGLFLGDLLGVFIGVEANVGGVGLGMILLILLSDRLRKGGRLTPLTEQGVLFWSAIYIPVVVAMAAKQNSWQRWREARWRSSREWVPSSSASSWFRC